MVCRMWPRRSTTAGWLLLLFMPLALRQTYAAAPMVNVSNVRELVNAVATMNDAGGDYSIVLADGTNAIASTLFMTGPKVALQWCGWHLLQIAGEDDAQSALIHNVVFRDGYRQLLAVSVGQEKGAAIPKTTTANGGPVEDSRFEYTAGIGPDYYIGGIDIHAGKHWMVRGNIFRSIIQPNTTVAKTASPMISMVTRDLPEVSTSRRINFTL